MIGDALAVPDNARMMAALEATWPAAAVTDHCGWRLRTGAGGGKRVSAASPIGAGGAIPEAEAAMRERGQVPLFQLTPGDAACDAVLAERGYRVLDPTILYAGPPGPLCGEGSHVARLCRARLAPAVMEEIWAAGGIGPGRLAVMERASGPAVRLLARVGDTPGGVGFVAVDDDIAMFHAVEVLARCRRRGAGRLLVEGAARFASEVGAKWLALAVLETNAPARALWEGLGMAEAGCYHYRIFPEAQERTR